MNNLKVFENQEFGKIRISVIQSEPWFVGKDVAEVLGYAKPRNAIAAHVDGEDKRTPRFRGRPWRDTDKVIFASAILFTRNKSIIGNFTQCIFGIYNFIFYEARNF